MPPLEPPTPPLAVMLALAAVAGVEEEQGGRGQPSSHRAIDDKGAIICRSQVVEKDEAAMFAARASPDGREGAFASAGNTLEIHLGRKHSGPTDTGTGHMLGVSARVKGHKGRAC